MIKLYVVYSIALNENNPNQGLSEILMLFHIFQVTLLQSLMYKCDITIIMPSLVIYVYASVCRERVVVQLKTRLMRNGR